MYNVFSSRQKIQVQNIKCKIKKCLPKFKLSDCIFEIQKYLSILLYFKPPFNKLDNIKLIVQRINNIFVFWLTGIFGQCWCGIWLVCCLFVCTADGWDVYGPVWGQEEPGRDVDGEGRLQPLHLQHLRSHMHQVSARGFFIWISCGDNGLVW